MMLKLTILVIKKYLACVVKEYACIETNLNTINKNGIVNG